MAFHVLYLTGAPAAGKSTLSQALKARLPDIAIFEYGAELTRYVAAKSANELRQEDLRRESAGIASAEDVAAVDLQLLDFVASSREVGHVVVDSHAVTKEQYGFRVTPYSAEAIRRLAPSIIVALYTEPRTAVERIRNAPAGRPIVSEWEAGFHTALQSSVAITYGVAVGVPVYLFDGARPTPDLVDAVEDLLRRAPRISKRADVSAQGDDG